MRRTKIFAVPVLVLALAGLAGLSACGGEAKADEVASANGAGNGTAAGASPGAVDPEQGRRFAQCMRDNGIPDFPDPYPNGGGGGFAAFGQALGGADRDKVRKALEACRSLMPNGGQRPGSDPAQQEQLRLWAQCMRDNGVDVPDPDGSGGGFLLGGNGSFNPGDPKFGKAMEACQDKFTFGRGPNQ